MKIKEIVVYALFTTINFIIAIGMMRFIESISVQIDLYHKVDWASNHLPRDRSWILLALVISGFFPAFVILFNIKKLFFYVLVYPYLVLLGLIILCWNISLDWVKLVSYI